MLGVSLLSSMAGKQKKIGIISYTMQESMQKNPEATLQFFAQTGYKWIELAGYTNRKYYGMEPEAIGKLIKSLGMELISSHQGCDLSNIHTAAEDAVKAGLKYLVKPAIGPEQRKSADAYKKVAEELNAMGEILKKHKIKMGYHNHAFEFETFDGKCGYDILLENTDPDLVSFELDIYWIYKAGYQPLDYFKKYPKRFELFHVKDMAKTPDEESVAIGSGRIDFEPLFKASDQAGMKYFFVEQEKFTNTTQEESVKSSFAYLNKASFIK